MEVNAVCTALVRIGFIDDAAQALIEQQGIDSLQEICILPDDEIYNLCKLLRRPGGTVPGAPGEGGAPGAAVPNPGIQVSSRAETNLKLLAIFIRHKACTSRAVAPATVTLDNIRAMRELRDYESTYTTPYGVPTINA